MTTGALVAEVLIRRGATAALSPALLVLGEGVLEGADGDMEGDTPLAQQVVDGALDEIGVQVVGDGPCGDALGGGVACSGQRARSVARCGAFDPLTGVWCHPMP